MYRVTLTTMFKLPDSSIVQKMAVDLRDQAAIAQLTPPAEPGRWKVHSTHVVAFGQIPIVWVLWEGEPDDPER